MKERLSTVGIVAIFMVVAFWGGFVVSNARWRGIVEDRITQGEDDFRGTELERVSELLRECQEDERAERKAKVDVMNDLNHTQWERDERYKEYLGCRDTQHALRLERDEFRKLPAQIETLVSNLSACETKLETMTGSREWWRMEADYYEWEWNYCIENK